LPLIWFAGWMREPERQAQARVFWPTAYWLFATLLAPTATFMYVQLSVLLMGWMLLQVVRTFVAPDRRGVLLSLVRT
jgi:hypothetical protein